MPSVAGAAALGVSLVWPHVRAELFGHYIAPRTKRTEAGQVRVMLGAAAARICGRVGPERVDVVVCGGFEAGAMRGDGRGASRARTAHGAWAAALATTGVHGRVSPRVALVGRVELAIPDARPAFIFSDPDQPLALFRPASLSGRVWVGLEFLLPGP